MNLLLLYNLILNLLDRSNDLHGGVATGPSGNKSIKFILSFNLHSLPFIAESHMT